MGEEEKAPEVAAEAEGSKSFFSKKNIIILVSLVVVLLLVSLFVVFKLIKPMVDEGEESEQVDIEAIGKKGTGVPYEFKEEFIVNVAGTGATRYLRVRIALELEDSATLSEVEDRVTQIRDLIIIVVGTKKIHQLDSIEMRNDIKKEILNGINDVLRNGHVTNVFFTDFVIQ